MNTDLRDGIGKLLQDTGHAHHKAFEVTDGADPDWPIWYAEYAKDTFAEQFGMNFSKSQLIYCLMNADYEYEARAPDSEELRDIFQDSQHRDDLVKARGRATVPVLRIESPDGEDRWMPESRDIVRYLQETYLR